MGILLFKFYKTEHFWFIPQGISICNNSDIASLNRHDCRRCTNAGICTYASGEKECVPGDFNGPYDKRDCVMYEYGNDYANLNLIDPLQPYLLDTEKRWNWRHS